MVVNPPPSLTSVDFNYQKIGYLPPSCWITSWTESQSLTS